MRPIYKDAAIRRIHTAKLKLTKAVNMSDDELLRLPSIGRRTLRFIRSLEILV